MERGREGEGDESKLSPLGHQRIDGGTKEAFVRRWVVGGGGVKGHSSHFLVASHLEGGSGSRGAGGGGGGGGLSLVWCRGNVSELQVDSRLTEWSEHRLDQHLQLHKPEQRQLQAPQLPATHTASDKLCPVHCTCTCVRVSVCVFVVATY